MLAAWGQGTGGLLSPTHRETLRHGWLRWPGWFLRFRHLRATCSPVRSTRTGQDHPVTDHSLGNGEQTGREPLLGLKIVILHANKMLYSHYYLRQLDAFVRLMGWPMPNPSM